jgi:hypothetical protein
MQAGVHYSDSGTGENEWNPQVISNAAERFTQRSLPMNAISLGLTSSPLLTSSDHDYTISPYFPNGGTLNLTDAVPHEGDDFLHPNGEFFYDSNLPHPSFVSYLSRPLAVPTLQSDQIHQNQQIHAYNEALSHAANQAASHSFSHLNTNNTLPHATLNPSHSSLLTVSTIINTRMACNGCKLSKTRCQLAPDSLPQMENPVCNRCTRLQLSCSWRPLEQVMQSRKRPKRSKINPQPNDQQNNSENEEKVKKMTLIIELSQLSSSSSLSDSLSTVPFSFPLASRMVFDSSRSAGFLSIQAELENILQRQWIESLNGIIPSLDSINRFIQIKRPFNSFLLNFSDLLNLSDLIELVSKEWRVSADSPSFIPNSSATQPLGILNELASVYHQWHCVDSRPFYCCYEDSPSQSLKETQPNEEFELDHVARLKIEYSSDGRDAMTQWEQRKAKVELMKIHSDNHSGRNMEGCGAGSAGGGAHLEEISQTSNIKQVKPTIENSTINVLDANCTLEVAIPSGRPLCCSRGHQTHSLHCPARSSTSATNSAASPSSSSPSTGLCNCLNSVPIHFHVTINSAFERLFGWNQQEVRTRFISHGLLCIAELFRPDSWLAFNRLCGRQIASAFKTSSSFDHQGFSIVRTRLSSEVSVMMQQTCRMGVGFLSNIYSFEPITLNS